MSFSAWRKMEKSFIGREAFLAAVGLFSEAVICADQAKRAQSNWALRSDEDRGWIRLYAGYFIVCTLGDGKIWCALDEPSMKSDPEKTEMLENNSAWQWDLYDYPKYSYARKYSRNGYFSPAGPSDKIMEAVKKFHLTYVSLVAEKTSIRPETISHHESGINGFVIQSAGIELPVPNYI